MLSKVKGWWGTLLHLCEKHTSVACFTESWLSNIFHQQAHWIDPLIDSLIEKWLISFKSLFSSNSECDPIVVLEKRYMSSANILHSEVTPSGKPFTYIRNNNCLETYPCGTPAKMFFHKDVCQFKMTYCCRSFNSYWVTLASYNLYRMFATSKLNHHAMPDFIKSFRNV